MDGRYVDFAVRNALAKAFHHIGGPVGCVSLDGTVDLRGAGGEDGLAQMVKTLAHSGHIGVHHRKTDQWLMHQWQVSNATSSLSYSGHVKHRHLFPFGQQGFFVDPFPLQPESNVRK